MSKNKQQREQERLAGKKAHTVAADDVKPQASEGVQERQELVDRLKESGVPALEKVGERMESSSLAERIEQQAIFGDTPAGGESKPAAAPMSESSARCNKPHPQRPDVICELSINDDGTHKYVDGANDVGLTHHAGSSGAAYRPVLRWPIDGNPLDLARCNLTTARGVAERLGDPEAVQMAEKELEQLMEWGGEKEPPFRLLENASQLLAVMERKSQKPVQQGQEMEDPAHPYRGFLGRAALFFPRDGSEPLRALVSGTATGDAGTPYADLMVCDPSAMAPHRRIFPTRATMGTKYGNFMPIEEFPGAPEGAYTYGELGFNAYGHKPGKHGPWKTFDGRDMPRWEALQGEVGELTRERWETAAREILRAAGGALESVLLRLVEASEHGETPLEALERVLTLAGTLKDMLRESEFPHAALLAVAQVAQGPERFDVVLVEKLPDGKIGTTTGAKSALWSEARDAAGRFFSTRVTPEQFRE